MFVKVQKVTHDSFNKYGQVVLLPNYPAPLGTETIKFWPALARYMVNGKTEIGICTCLKRPRKIDSMERHLNTPEILIPLDDNFLLPIAVPSQPVNKGNKLKVKGIQIMNIKKGTAVIMEPGVWHWAVWPENGKSVTYLVLFKLNTPRYDFDKKSLEKTIGF